MLSTKVNLFADGIISDLEILCNNTRSRAQNTMPPYG